MGTGQVLQGLVENWGFYWELETEVLWGKEGWALTQVFTGALW